MRQWTSDRPSSCPSGLALDQWLAGELVADRESEIDTHVQICAHCREWKAMRDEDRATFLADAPTFASHAARWGKGVADARRAGCSRRARWIGPRVAMAVAAAAAAVAVILLIRHPDVNDRGERTKGQPHLTLFVQRGQQVRRGGNGEVVKPGDKIRFAYTVGEARHLAIVGMDARGTVERYFPATGATSMLDPGSVVPLPFAVELDDVLGQETVFGLFCRAPIDVDAIVRGLAQSGRTPALPACAVDRVVLDKGPR